MDDRHSTMAEIGSLSEQEHLLSRVRRHPRPEAQRDAGQGRAPGLKLAPVCVSFLCLLSLQPLLRSSVCPHILLDLVFILRGAKVLTIGSL